MDTLVGVCATIHGGTGECEAYVPCWDYAGRGQILGNFAMNHGSRAVKVRSGLTCQKYNAGAFSEYFQVGIVKQVGSMSS